MNSIPGAFGALGLDVALGMIPIPANWKAGMFGYLTKAVGAIGIGMLWNMFGSARTATQMTEGALTVMLHGAMRELVAANIPQIPLGMYLPGMEEGVKGLGYYGSGWNPSYALDAYEDQGLNAYLPDLSNEPISVTDEDYM